MKTNPSLITALRGPVALSHLLLQNYVYEGCYAVDATCGNGNDTLYLANLVGEKGHVWGFDIQADAIAETASKIEAANLSNRVTLLNYGHEKIDVYINVPLNIVVFNLGYLPKGDHSIITKPETTILAIKKSAKFLAENGIIVITIYHGHAGGAEERFEVESLLSTLNPKKYCCWRMGQTNVNDIAPYLLLIQRIK